MKIERVEDVFIPTKQIRLGTGWEDEISPFLKSYSDFMGDDMSISTSDEELDKCENILKTTLPTDLRRQRIKEPLKLAVDQLCEYTAFKLTQHNLGLAKGTHDLFSCKQQVISVHPGSPIQIPAEMFFKKQQQLLQAPVNKVTHDVVYPQIVCVSPGYDGIRIGVIQQPRVQGDQTILAFTDEPAHFVRVGHIRNRFHDQPFDAVGLNQQGLRKIFHQVNNGSGIILVRNIRYRDQITRNNFLKTI